MRFVFPSDPFESDNEEDIGESELPSQNILEGYFDAQTLAPNTTSCVAVEVKMNTLEEPPSGRKAACDGSTTFLGRKSKLVTFAAAGPAGCAEKKNLKEKSTNTEMRQEIGETRLSIIVLPQVDILPQHAVCESPPLRHTEAISRNPPIVGHEMQTELSAHLTPKKSELISVSGSFLSPRAEDCLAARPLKWCISPLTPPMYRSSLRPCFPRVSQGWAKTTLGKRCRVQEQLSNILRKRAEYGVPNAKKMKVADFFCLRDRLHSLAAREAHAAGRKILPRAKAMDFFNYLHGRQMIVSDRGNILANRAMKWEYCPAPAEMEWKWAEYVVGHTDAVLQCNKTGLGGSEDGLCAFPNVQKKVHAHARHKSSSRTTGSLNFPTVTIRNGRAVFFIGSHSPRRMRTTGQKRYSGEVVVVLRNGRITFDNGDKGR